MNPVTKFSFMYNNRKNLYVLKISKWSIELVVNFVTG